MHIVSSYPLHCRNPLCLPSWRWDWAQTLVGEQRPWPADIDESGLSALRLAQHVGYEGSVSPGETSRQLTNELAALAIQRGDPVQCNLLQAWLLSGATDDQIGLHLGFTPSIAHRYEQIFYSVRDHLQARDWIVFVACDWPLDPDGYRDITRTVRLLAYFGGPQVLEVVLIALGMTSARGAGYPVPVVDESLAKRARVLVDVLRHPPRGVMAFRLLAQLKELRAKCPEGTASHWRATQAEVDAMLDDLWTNTNGSESLFIEGEASLAQQLSTA